MLETNARLDIGFTDPTASESPQVANAAAFAAPELRKSYDEATDLLTLTFTRTDATVKTCVLTFT